MKRKVKKNIPLRELEEGYRRNSLTEIITYLSSLLNEYEKLGYSNLRLDTDFVDEVDWLYGDFRETDEDYKKRLLVKEEKERQEYERLKNKFEK